MREADERSDPVTACRYRQAAGAIFVVLGVLVFATFRHYGITWDEYVQREYGAKLIAFYASGFKDTYAFGYANLFYYGGFFDIIAGVLERISPFDGYQTRHLFGGLFTIFGLWGAWKLADLLAGPRAALIAIVLLAATPMLYGHGFGNPKDAPLAWLSIWATYFACRMIVEAPRIAAGTIIGAGLVLGAALGQRVIAAHLPVWFVLTVMVWFVLDARARCENSIAILKAVLLTVPLAIAVMAFFWPWSVMAPGNIVTAMKVFSHSPWDAWFLWDGQRVPSTDLPARYLPTLLAYSLPEVFLLALAAGLVGLVRAFPAVRGDSRTVAWIFVALTALAPIALAMILRPTMYNNMRHFLFVIPPLGVLAAVGIEYLLRRPLPRLVPFAGAALAAGLALPIVEMVRLHPYEYVYFNALTGGVRGAEGRFELDYWGASLTEAARMLDAYADAGNVYVCGKETSADYALDEGFKVTKSLDQAAFYIGIDDPYCTDRFAFARPPIAEVKRDGVALSSVYDLRGAQSKQR